MVSPFRHRDYGTIHSIDNIRLTRAWNANQGALALDPELNSLFILELETSTDVENYFAVLTKAEMLALFAAFLEVYDSYGFENG